MTKLDHNRDVLRRIDDSIRSKRTVGPHQGVGVPAALFPGQPKSHRAYLAFVESYAHAISTEQELPQVPKRLLSAVRKDGSAPSQKDIEVWLRSRNELENALGLIAKRKKRKRKPKGPYLKPFPDAQT